MFSNSFVTSQQFTDLSPVVTNSCVKIFASELCPYRSFLYLINSLCLEFRNSIKINIMSCSAYLLTVVRRKVTFILLCIHIANICFTPVLVEIAFDTLSTQIGK